ncbi:hypothetical protein [Streptomyces sp. NPDC047999]|uniref:hypothetical protein n=1 Tax=Streptomyces sp. NPDC047999 TaxID=3365497 RepID=UPI0037131142
MKDDRKPLVGLLAPWGVVGLTLLIDMEDHSWGSVLDWVSLVLFAVLTGWVARELSRRVRRRGPGGKREGHP